MTNSDPNLFGGYFGPLDPSHSPDLSANRAGELTAEQKKSLRGRFLPRFLGSAIGFLFIVPFLLCLGGPIFLSMRNEEDLLFSLVFIGFFVLIFGVVLLGLLISSIRPGLALFDVMNGRVETADGRLAWRGREWRGEVEGGGDLHLSPGVEQMPGAYRFYYLPRARYIVATETLKFSGQDSDPLAEVRRALGSVFDFVDEDLPDNRAGRLSGRQQSRHFFSAVRSAIFLSPFLLMALGFGLGFPIAFVVYPLFTGERLDEESWIPAVCGGGLGLLFLGFLAWAIVSPFLDLWRGEITGIEGAVEERAITTGSGKNRRTNYYYIVNNQRFDVGQRGHQALIQGRRYRLYYYPRSKRVVSVEPLAEASPDFASARL